MRTGRSRKKQVTLLLSVVLAAVAAVLLFVSGHPGKNHYHLSDARLFGISNLDQVVETIRDSLKNRSQEIRIRFSFRGDYLDDISPFVKELMELAQEETGDPEEGDYIRWQLGGYTFSYGHEPFGEEYRYAISIVPEYYSSYAQEQETTEKVKEILQGLSLSRETGTYEKIRAVHDYLVENVNYDLVHKKNLYHTVKSTAYGALVNHSATCQGYAVAVYRLLKELGVNCRVITGQGESESGSEFHAWNIVELDGKYYNLDVTWNDVQQSRIYFLKSDADFDRHRRDDIYCTADFYNAYPPADQSIE